MDNLTHTLVGLTLSYTPLGRACSHPTAAFVLASNLPDVEVITFLASGRIAYLESHRGATHGPLGIAGAALATAAIVRWWPRRSAATEARQRFWPLAAVALAGVLCHVLLDLATSYGTRVLSPFSNVWFGVDWLPIVEPYLLALLVIGLAVVRMRPCARARLASVTLLLAAALCGGRALLHEAAVNRALIGDVTWSPARYDRAPSGPRPTRVFRYLWPATPPELPAALPTVWSPFRWRIVRAVPGGWELGELNLLSSASPPAPVFHPRAEGPWVELASQAPTPRAFVAFVRFPAVFVSRRPNGDVIVRWNDIRFATPGRVSAPDGSNPASRFGAWARLSRDRRLVGHGLGSG